MKNKQHTLFENKQQVLFEQVQEFFEQLLSLKSSEKMKQYLKFCARMPNHSTFNSTLVFIQKPSCYYYATKSQWGRFNRKPRRSAKPLLILRPFAPVEFVYDLEDTDGKPLPKDFIYWWKEEKGGISKEKFKNLIKLCEELHIKTSISSTDYLREEGHRTFGIAYRKLDNNEHGIELHPRYNDPEVLQEAFGVLVHEIAHHLLGHLGEIKISKVSSKEVIIIKDARGNDRSVREVEAELTAWLLFSKYGIAKKSAAYMAGWITKQNAKSARIVEVGKTVENIYKMSEGKRWWR
ncbi:MAG: hypothetical protein A2931_04145 [Candidatus Niyogibacteria bacterium RIFCSPLOWO2_01_FULL_45_48]|uniref:IrrE N-terminal-like domain-containing protein n=2 Tax=Candidatus Niyogiibacteriota TaxID=1817912 RepID=A0A1G2EXH7_9BACT|nr:MAG: hypothetical protein A2931_04145 [Candidatus Niyogibacteria bacterium RIFCSPLOWO2_01_FULL_45_48]OGZ30516.1 MAG: hypothetical protein A3J00_03495 [Candidatus Niyogibacteria bacterium RIFCSPLOWO2_02_FULL_45_13]